MCSSLFRSSLGKKCVVAVTGFMLSLFVIAHLFGNLQIFLGQQQFNSYAEHLRNLPLLVWPARSFLLLTLLLHLTVSLWLAVENKKARPVPYGAQATVEASLASRTMVITGLMIFAFVVYHLLHFTFGKAHPEFFNLTDPKGHHDVYSMVILSFGDVFIAGAYVIAMALLSFHLSHGLASAFQSLGMNDERWDGFFRKMALGVSLLIFLGYVSIPAAAFFGFLKPVIPGGL